MAKLAVVEGIGDVYAAKLAKVGVTTTNGLLNKGATSKGRDKLAQTAGISSKLILEWVNHCDLFRITGVGEEYADLLEEAGVDTVPELAQRNPGNLYNKMVETNNKKELVRRLPSAAQVAGWVAQAKTLKRVITY